MKASLTIWHNSLLDGQDIAEHLERFTGHHDALNSSRSSLLMAGRACRVEGTGNEAPAKPVPVLRTLWPKLCYYLLSLSSGLQLFFLQPFTAILLTEKPGPQYLPGTDVLSVVLPSW